MENLRFYVQNNVIVIKEITPREILIDLYKRNLLKTYKGVPYRNKYDLFKIMPYLSRVSIILL